MNLDDLDLFTPQPAVVPTPRKCRRHVWVPNVVKTDSSDFRVTGYVCARCGKPKDPAISRRGKNNRNRGNAIEREIAAKLGLRRVGQFGGADDIRGLAFAGQVKSGAAFPERLWSWLRAVPVNADETAILVVTDAPGPGHQRRALVILDLEDWRSLHGPSGHGKDEEP